MSGPDTEKGFPVSYPGPFSHHDLVVNGWRVPFVTAHPSDDEQRVTLILDERLGDTFTVAEAERFAPFLADAIAIALGYTCHPREDEEPNFDPQPRPVRMHGIVGVETEQTP